MWAEESYVTADLSDRTCFDISKLRDELWTRCVSWLFYLCLKARLFPSCFPGPIFFIAANNCHNYALTPTPTPTICVCLYVLTGGDFFPSLPPCFVCDTTEEMRHRSTTYWHHFFTLLDKNKHGRHFDLISTNAMFYMALYSSPNME